MSNRNQRKKKRKQAIAKSLQQGFQNFKLWPETINGVTFKQAQSFGLSPFIVLNHSTIELTMSMKLIEQTLFKDYKERFILETINTYKPPLKLRTFNKEIPFFYLEVPWAKILLTYGSKNHRALITKQDYEIEEYFDQNRFPFIYFRPTKRKKNIEVFLKTPSKLLNEMKGLPKVTSPIVFFLTLEFARGTNKEDNLSPFLGHFAIPPGLNPFVGAKLFCRSTPLVITLGNFCSSLERETFNPFLPYPSLPSLNYKIENTLSTPEQRRAYLELRKF